jgi:phage FluMu protein Com
MLHEENATWWQGDREIFPEDVAYIRTFAKRFPGLSRTELTCTLCEHLDWLTPAGRAKFEACSKLLARMEEAGCYACPRCRKTNAIPAPVPAHRHVRALEPSHRYLWCALSRSSMRYACDW